MGRVQSHAGDQQAAGAQGGGEVGDDGFPGAGGEEGDDVAGGEHQVEVGVQAEGVQPGEVARTPVLAGRFAPGDGEHRGVDVHACAAVAQFGEADRDAAGSAARVEHLGGGLHQRGAEGGLPVDVLARRGEPGEAPRVLLPRLSPGEFRPAVALPRHAVPFFRPSPPGRSIIERAVRGFPRSRTCRFPPV